MKTNIHDDKCYHCGQILTPDARKHLEKIEGLLEKSPEQIEAEEKAEAKRVSDLVDQEVKAKLKENEKSPEQIEAEEKAAAQAATDATNAGIEKGKSLIQEELAIERKEKEIFKKQNQDLKADIAKHTSNTKSISGELVGNLQDKTVFDILVAAYPDDEFKDYSVGEPGADILQTVIHNNKKCGGQKHTANLTTQ